MYMLYVYVVYIFESLENKNLLIHNTFQVITSV